MKMACVVAVRFIVAGVLIGVLCSDSEADESQYVSREEHQLKFKSNLTVALILPKTSFGTRSYTRAVHTAVSSLQKARGPKPQFISVYGPLQLHYEMMSLTPSPTGISTYLLTLEPPQPPLNHSTIEICRGTHCTFLS